MFDWMERLVADVPEDWSTELVPARAGEKVLGRIPNDLMRVFRAVAYARDRAVKLAEKHTEVDDCKGAHMLCTDMLNRANTMSAALSLSIREYFGTPLNSNVQIRREGAVLVTPPPVPSTSFMDLLRETLRAQGPPKTDVDEDFYDL